MLQETSVKMNRGLEEWKNSYLHDNSYTSNPPDLYTSKKHAAFTLAEVLITLGIIGVVAAMTLPTVIQNYKKKEIASRLKKFNSMMLQAITMSELENGPAEEWDMQYVPTYINKYLNPYLKIKYSHYNNGGYYVYFFYDGTNFSVGKGECMDFHYDINGNSKPNKLNMDIFRFYACPKDVMNKYCGKKWCVGHGDVNLNTTIQNCKNGIRDYCPTWIEANGWEIPKDYPYKF